MAAEAYAERGQPLWGAEEGVGEAVNFRAKVLSRATPPRPRGRFPSFLAPGGAR